MHRRDAIRNVAILLGTAISASTLSALESCTGSAPKSYDLHKPETKTLLAEIAETIIPKTDTPGAKEAKVEEFIITMINDCYKKEDQERFLEGLSKIDAAAKKQFKNGFNELTPQQRTELLTQIDKERVEYNNRKDKKENDPPHHFQLLKELTLLGYFTSEQGATKALRYVPVPGKYEGCIPYTKGEKAWAS
ncbi:gluconate 2-dehydrogenase subunit 3 family protein [Chitinophaga nivalis]|uniref:Gluconate 2-dehydrogenase subunit 3 family protein n=1 Tax=Chitinophaga nivalis TaxID=2991709 RepID=A0ABT3IHL3_9BACT|nr:gluconate 2-dehydrogenase subunit 3 family protein [Chitinophaga nivalis]MCW3466867.1 gluconate 2-dehydrogenase subunit 3 family protein [Chitinophaga nivalis]MCW3483442.1 gluconate 2-dehydrogenase subunit 3 family protein [Chitinophaga nivalis]